MKQKLTNFIQSTFFSKFSTYLILLNVFVIVLESYRDLYVNFILFFKIFETFSIIIFTLEYLTRIWITEKKLKFIFSPMGIIDLIAVLPFYLPFIFSFDLRVVRILRLFRLIRVFKLTRYSKSLSLILDVLKETKSELMITIFFSFVLLLFSSTLMFYAENVAQPEKFTNIIDSLWWAVATLTTVGYGDIYPITGLGKLLAAIISLIGIGFIALPTGIISSAFIEKVKNNAEEKQVLHKCPHCHKDISLD